jgi:hypothetical protein
MARAVSHIGKRFNVQAKGTPLRYPRNNGGSPRGVKLPPILDTTKMKNTGMWYVYFLSLFVFNNGRMSSMLAPVVPIRLHITAPRNRNEVFTAGVARRSPVSRMPPEMMKSDANRRMKEM